MPPIRNRRNLLASRRPLWLASFALLLAAFFSIGVAAAQDPSDVSVDYPPPAIPDYDQPPLPGDGYVWSPGYWAWSDDDQDYYWVPGTWVTAPVIGYLWTPGYWYADGGLFVWYPGYWGMHVGFYGGVNYGHGYGGRGYAGGYWQGGHLFYNRAATNLGNAPIGNVYSSPIVTYGAANRTSFNGGSGGIQVQATPAELAAASEPHLQATVLQRQHDDAARATPTLRASANRGVPPIAATARPGEFTGSGAVAARRGSATPAYAPPSPSERAERAVSPSPRTTGGAPTAAYPVRQAPAAPRAFPPQPHPNAPKPKDEHEHREP
jgi:hypothetical protein